MDFIASKVAMSICALTVAGILGGIAENADTPDICSDLDGVLTHFNRLISHVLRSGAECSIDWTLPIAHTDGVLHMEILGDRASASSDGVTRWATLCEVVHTWPWDGSVLNQSTIDALDSACQSVRIHSGQSVTIDAIEVETGEGADVMLFLRRNVSEPR
jgi:hypothetical protein